MSDGWAEREFYPAPAGENAALAQELFDRGVVFRMNEAVLHAYGYALGAVTNDEGRVVGLALFKSNDPNGIWFDEATTEAGRNKMRKAGLLGIGPMLADDDEPMFPLPDMDPRLEEGTSS